LVTLFAARNAGIAVPDEAIRKGLAYLNNNRGTEGSYGYTSASGGKPTLTAIGIALPLARQGAGLEGLSGQSGVSEEEHRLPGPLLSVLLRILHVAGIVPRRRCDMEGMERPQHPLPGHHPGHGRIVSRNQGPSFNTAGALLSLALNYRYLPIYEK
jgi:hypothetical protein